MSFDLCFQLRLTTVILVIGELSKTCMLIHKNISLTTRQLSYELHVVPALSKDIIPILQFNISWRYPILHDVHYDFFLGGTLNPSYSRHEFYCALNCVCIR